MVMWGLQFISTRGHEYFCEIDEEYLTDRFNLTGLQGDVQYYQYALDLITDVFEFDCDDDIREQIEKSARHLYGLVHARYIITSRGLGKMVCFIRSASFIPYFSYTIPLLLLCCPSSSVCGARQPTLMHTPQLEKYKKNDFGRCPRVLCHSHPLLPIGLSDLSQTKSVKLYCAKCEDTYSPKSSRHAAIDGAYFGTSFPHILFQVYPQLVPAKTNEVYVPRVFGFKTHAMAALARWQQAARDAQDVRLRAEGIDVKRLELEEIDESEDEESVVLK